MRQIQTDVLVIGGGATGTGVLRDLAMRGFQCVLIERRDLAYGTTGRYHGLLHSGGRYVVKDPQAARECIEENQILRRIMPQCIEDTGGYFVLTPQDDPAYVPLFLLGCKNAGIPVEEIPIPEMLKTEPLMDAHIQRCFRVPDGSADSFLAAELNAQSAVEYGAQLLLYHEFTRLLFKENSSNSSVIIGAVCQNIVKDEEVQIYASLVVNASGAWAGKVVQTAGVELVMVPGKGTMVALNHRVVNTVINRCKLPADGDILVPAHTVAVMGTTDIKVTDPDHYAIEPWEIRLMLDEGEKIIPCFKQFRILRAWAGVRPLVQTSGTTSDRDISRGFVLLDHATRDGMENLVTITSGKWTTYRKMAQETVNLVCQKLKVDQPCRTHLEPLPPNNGHPAYHQSGHRLEQIEHEYSYGQLMCECELVKVDEVQHSIIQSNAATLDDIRRDTRLGMGPCQAAFCSLRAMGMLHTLRKPPVEMTNVSLRDFLNERWKGNLPILFGQQLRQARFNEYVYINVLNADHLPGESASKLAAETYSESFTQPTVVEPSLPLEGNYPPSTHHLQPQDVLVIGAGLAGLTTAWQLGEHGKHAKVITRGWGAHYWGTGCIDIIGYAPPDYQLRIDSPSKFLEEYLTSNPDHPYALAGLAALENAADAFLALCREAGYPYSGSLDKNILLATSLGTLRPTCLVPETMMAGDCSENTPMLIVGFDRFFDFYPSLIADNLSFQGILAQELVLELPSLRKRKFVTAMVLARLFDDPAFCQEVSDAIKPRLGSAGRVGFPAVLGLKDAHTAIQHLQASLGVPVFEIPGMPPSIPGIRLQNILVSSIEQRHGVVSNGMLATDSTNDGTSILSVHTEAAARHVDHLAKSYVLATGGFLGGGITSTNNVYAQEPIFNLPITPSPAEHPYQNQFISPPGHPRFRTGIRIDHTLQPTDQADHPLYSNLYAAGSLFHGCDSVRERSLEGIALATAFRVAEVISKERES